MASECCAALAPVSAEYTPKGSYETIAGLKTYVITPSSTSTPNRAIIDIYDVFGLAPQTIQGADRLSAATKSVVLVPDFFEGDWCHHDWVGPNVTPEGKAELGKFVQRRVDYVKAGEKLLEIRKEVAERWPEVEGHVGVFGLCFGGKVAVLATGKGNEGVGRKFNVSGTGHPARLDVKEHEELNVPHICLASPGEPADVVAQVKEILSQPGKVGHVETYESMFHGWMGARANLKDEKNLKEYERGYNAVADFFNKYL